MLKPSDRERQKISPPRIHSTDPAQPMKRAAPSSNLQVFIVKQNEMYVWNSFHPHQRYLPCNPEYLLLSNKERVKEVSCDPVSVYGACNQRAEACGEK